MRRLGAIAAFALLLAVPLWAQHGGGHGGGGHSGGFGGGHAGFGGGHVGGGHAFGGMHAGSGAGRGFGHGPSYSHHPSSHPFSSRGFGQRGFSNRGFRGRGPYQHDRFRGGRFRGYGFRNNCYGYGCGYNGYPWAYGGLYDPYWWGDTGSSYDDDYQQNLATAAEMNRQNLEEQRMLRQEEADGDQDSYAEPERAPRTMRPGNTTNDESQGAAIMPNTVLVFRDQHKEEISNYAIVGQTLWNFGAKRPQRIPLSQLDLPATTKANEDLGVTFRVPGGEAQ